LNGGLLETSHAANWGGGHDIIIDGLTIDGAGLIGGGIFLSNGSHHVTVENCVIRNTGSTGIEANASDYVTVAHNLIYHAGYNQGFSSGITLWYGGVNPAYGGHTAWYDRAAAFHNVIADNIVSGTYDNSSDENDGNGIIVDGSGSIPPALIVNNLVYENGGRGVEINQTSGNIWVVNNTGYANGLDLKVGGGQAAEFAAIFAKNVHLVNNLAFGRTDGRRYRTGYTYMNVQSTISWAHNLGFNGTLLGIGSIGADAQAYRQANPMLNNPPAIPATSTPWASAIPPWRIGDDLMLRTGSPAITAGVDPASVAGLSGALVDGLQKYA